MEIRPFKDRCYAVFGATGWVGSVLCHNLRMGGAQICMGARSRERLTLLAREMSAVSQALDIAKAGDTDIILNFSLSRMKKLDGVICCIGSPWAPPLQRFSGAEWDRRVAESVQAAASVADSIAWLLIPQQAWITGRILDTEGARMLGSD